MMEIVRLHELNVSDVEPLVVESESAGYQFVRRLVDEFGDGTNRFDKRGEALFAAVVASRVVAVCGLNVDPYTDRSGLGRVRHLYVLESHRRRAFGTSLVTAVVSAAQDDFHLLRLRTHNDLAVAFYQKLGFCRVSHEPNCTHVLRLRGPVPYPLSPWPTRCKNG